MNGIPGIPIVCLQVRHGLAAKYGLCNNLIEKEEIRSGCANFLFCACAEKMPPILLGLIVLVVSVIINDN